MGGMGLIYGSGKRSCAREPGRSLTISTYFHPQWATLRAWAHRVLSTSSIYERETQPFWGSHRRSRELLCPPVLILGLDVSLPGRCPLAPCWVTHHNRKQACVCCTSSTSQTGCSHLITCRWFHPLQACHIRTRPASDWHAFFSGAQRECSCCCFFPLLGEAHCPAKNYSVIYNHLKIIQYILKNAYYLDLNYFRFS